MKITNEISNNFELLACSKNGEADLSILSGLFSINFGEGSLDDKVKKNIDEFIFNEDKIKFVDYISNIIPTLEKDTKKHINFETIKTQISLDNSINSEDKDRILQFLNQGKNYSKSFQINMPQQTHNKLKNKIVISKLIKTSNVSSNNLAAPKKINHSQSFDKNIVVEDISKYTKSNVELSKSREVNETRIIDNKNTFVKKIRKNNYPNKIYQPLKSKTLQFEQLKDMTLNKKINLSENNSTISMHNYSALETIKKNKNDVKLNNTQSFNVNITNQTSNLGQNLSHNNDSSFSNNGYNSVLENLLDHLDLSQKGWTSKLVSRIENALSNGGEEIEFNLKPKNLGMLKVSVSQKNGMNTVKIIAENSFVTSALAQNENYLQKLFNDQGMNLDFTAQNESQSFGSKSSFSQNSNEQHKNKNNGPDEKLNQTKEKNDVVGSEDDSSRHMINVIA
ncbi:flagellar hook-length control protein FliK [Alphaproteobacteria bacterium]|nr:flagellar hook-length control protein FliK [Alphaproteobacteria bacterium]